jgi:hypothetical protein
MTQVLQFRFRDGHVMVVKPTDMLRVRNVNHMGVQLWQAQHLADGVMPPCPPHTAWLYVTERGEEHDLAGLVAAHGTLTPVEPPAPTVQDIIAISEATVPVEEPVVEVKKGKKGRAVA